MDIMKTNYIVDASGFINGFPLDKGENFTVSEITDEIKDFETKLRFDEAINSGSIRVLEPSSVAIEKLEEILLNSGDGLRLSKPDKMIIALAMDFVNSNKDVVVVTDDYSIQNELKINNIKYLGVATRGINGIYNWKKVCEGCKKEFPDDYPYDDCEICGSKLFKKRIKLKK